MQWHLLMDLPFRWLALEVYCKCEAGKRQVGVGKCWGFGNGVGTTHFPSSDPLH
jgi:hypothetical protein